MEYKLFTNFYYKEIDDILCKLNMAGITEYKIEKEATDMFGNLMKTYNALYLLKDEDDYKINLLYQSGIVLMNTIYDYYKENGINILPANKLLLRLNLEPEEIKLLCTREISREEWYV